MLECPGCRSTELMIRLPQGLERVKIWWQKTREYKCAVCQHTFRAQDRRRYPRATQEDAVPLSTRSAGR